MNKKWFVIPIVAVILVFIIYRIVALWNDPLKRMKVIKQVAPNTVTEGKLPDEWGENFDPRLNPATFMVDGESKTENSLELTYAFPPSKKGEKIESMLVCEQGVVICFAVPL